jgi:MarR family transcriptional regulator, organic hydroperoxide resistance regulator
MRHDGESVLLGLQRATHVTLHLLADELASLGLTLAEINALANFSDGRSRTISQLGAATGTRPTTLTSVLDRLERHGHIARSTAPHDRRSISIDLTPSGRLAAATIRRTMAKLERRTFGALPPAAIDGFHAVVHALTEASP